MLLEASLEYQAGDQATWHSGRLPDISADHAGTDFDRGWRVVRSHAPGSLLFAPLSIGTNKLVAQAGQPQKPDEGGHGYSAYRNVVDQPCIDNKVSRNLLQMIE